LRVAAGHTCTHEPGAPLNQLVDVPSGWRIVGHLDGYFGYQPGTAQWFIPGCSTD
jgi:hypothetical protein